MSYLKFEPFHTIAGSHGEPFSARYIGIFLSERVTT